jgi:hypothetical protein
MFDAEHHTVPAVKCFINGTPCLIGNAPITYSTDFAEICPEDLIEFPTHDQEESTHHEIPSPANNAGLLPNNLIIVGSCIYRLKLIDPNDIL